MLELCDLKKLHDKAYSSNQVTREQASDDLIFYWVTQWDDQLLSDSQLQYRGEFNILRKAGRQIISDLRLNPVQPDFHPKDEARKDDAELMDGLYRADDRNLSSQEAYDNATQDQVVCGYGAWELYTEFASNRIGDLNQVIKRKYIPEANNTCFWDPNATSLDKSDANYVSILYRYSEDAYKDLVKDLTGEEYKTIQWSSFDMPEESYTFPWTAEQKKIYVTTFYHRTKVKDKVITLTDPFGEEIVLRESDIERQMDQLSDAGFRSVGEKEIERWEITRYIASGERILSSEVVSGENIPVVPVYGEHVPQIEGEEYWTGITRLAKDPQRLRNFQMSYLADIVSRSPRPKPIFYPEQIQGFEFMYEQTGADDNYPYLLQNRKSLDGEPLPPGAVGQTLDQPIPTALGASIELTRQAVEDVANPGLPQNIADPDLSGKAVMALQSRMDQQSYIYQHNFKHAKKRDAEIYASIASEIIDTPRILTMQTPDGQTRQVEIMQSITDKDTGEQKVINDITTLEFDVYAEIGKSYETQKQQTIETLLTMMGGLSEQDPLRNILLMKTIELVPGVRFDDVRDYAHKQLIILGIKEPETEEDEMVLAQSQQQQAPSADMILAQAEQLKGQAAQMREQTNQFKAQNDAQNDNAKTQIDQFNAQTTRMNTQIDAEKAGAEIDYKRADAMGKKIDNIAKRNQAFRARLMPTAIRLN